MLEKAPVRWGPLVVVVVVLLAQLLAAEDELTTVAEPVDYSSCQGRCVEDYFPGRPCYCNPNCQQYENCCDDYYAECKPEYVWSDEWSEFDGHAYKFFSDLQVTSPVAREACRGHGGLLVSINSAEEQNFIGNSVLRQRTLSAFIGGSDSNDEGHWKWADGTKMPNPTDSLHFWYPGQPDDADIGEDCALISNYMFWVQRKRTLDNYAWLDYNCAINNREIQGYICERTLACEPNPCQHGGTCYYVGAAEDFRCECTDGFFGLQCEIQLDEGQAWTQCGDTDLTGSSGVVTSPLYPRDYPPNVRCQWAINVGEGKTISLSIEMLDLESSKGCFFDSLTITDGNTTSGSRLIGPACGDLSTSNDTALTLPVTTSGHAALIDFRTDATKSGHGFRLIYKADRCGRGAGDSGCGVPQTFETDCGRTEFTQGPAEGATCQWDIRVPDGKLINLTFTEFYIQDTGAVCSSGGLVVYDGSIGPTAVVGRACGRRFPWSVISTSSRLYLRLQGTTWDKDIHTVAFQYTSFNVSSWHVTSSPHIIDIGQKASGSISASTTPVNVETEDTNVHTWLVRCQVGDRLHLKWTLFSSMEAHVQIYDGYSVYSHVVTSQTSSSTTKSGDVTATTFQLLVKVTSNRTDNSLQFDATYRAEDWTPTLSGCYRPLFSSQTDSLSTENSVVLPDQPVVVMVSESANHATHPGYDPGLYCKWTIRGEAGKRIKLHLLDFNTPPNLPDCDSDGLVVYDPYIDTIKGKLCGASSAILQNTFVSTSEVLDIYFYSDTRGIRREGGKLRAIVTTAERTSCEFHQMETSSNPTLDTSCGLLLSPWFPGMVPPGLWTWTLEVNGTNYFVVNVHYVRGPALIRQCHQYFQIREVPVDSTTLKQYESNLIKLCEDTDVFIPKHSIKNPPGQKLAIELKTITSSNYQRWEFKISYSSSKMEKPLYTEGPPGACPEGYSYYRGNCYMYEEWVKRHYKPEKYKYQTTWQASYDRCRSDDATLLTIKDQEEADYIKYKLTTDPWFWDPSAPVQLNHRTIYLGLSNQQGDYIWNDGVQLAYSDWFQPVESWAQPIVHDDEQDKYKLLGLTLPEPKPDLGSVCTALLVRSPFGSLNWAKLPCDYPIFRAGLICKKPATDNTTNEVTALHNTTLKQQQTIGYLGCEPGWRLLGDICFRMNTDYVKVIASKVSEESNSDPPRGMTYTEAEAMCSSDGGRVGLSGSQDLHTIKIYLDIWRHDLYMGDIWMDGDGDQCRIIQVSKKHRLSDEVQYQLVEGNCEDIVKITARPYNVLCSTDPILLKEACVEGEFQCENGVCISIDFVCDGHNDCFDNTDEAQCPGPNECGMDTFHCGNGQCISMSFYCDFTDNCVDGADEDHCVTETCQSSEFRCDSGECIPEISTCDFKKDCKDGSDESANTCDGSCHGFQCFSGLCLPSSMQHDVISDCPGVALEDEIDMSRDLLTIWDLDNPSISIEKKNGTYLGCKEPSEAQCMPGYDKCFRRADTCVYDTVIADGGRATRIQATCREGSHLRTSCSEVACPGMFRCPAAYCVPYSKVCDGRKDCPQAEDEAHCEDYTCPGLFHCKMESFCLPHNKVCDGHKDCPVHGEDEKYCGLTDVLCQDVCHCKGNIASCFNITSLPAPIDSRTRTLRAIIISNSKLEIRNDSFVNLHWLGKLGLSTNGIRRLPPYAFKDLTNLFELDLSGNTITNLHPEVFNGLVSLRVLNLDNNKLDSIDRNTFSRLSALNHIVITKNPLTDVTQDAFTNVQTLATLYSDAYKFCCIAKQVETCTPEPDEFSSCEDLMANYPLQVSIWVLGIFAFAGNMFVIIWRIKTDRSKVSSFLIINLGCSDFFMGLYMLIIASVDSHYRGQYIVYAEKWKSSTLCQIAGMLAMLSSEVSVFMLTIISADRLFVIFFPFKAKLRLSQARYLVFSTWIMCFLLSIIPALKIPYFGDSFFGSTGVCLPFQMNNEQRPGWEYSVFIFLVLNLMSFIFIAVAYIMIFFKVRKEAQKMGAAASSTTDDVSLAKKLMLIVATDLMCWVPIILIGFVALGGVKIPAQVSAWIAVFVLPLNSAVNPILYTMSAIDCSGKKKKPPKSVINTTVSRMTETSVGGTAIKMRPNGNTATANTA